MLDKPDPIAVVQDWLAGVKDSSIVPPHVSEAIAAALALLAHSERQRAELNRMNLINASAEQNRREGEWLSYNSKWRSAFEALLETVKQVERDRR